MHAILVAVASQNLQVSGKAILPAISNLPCFEVVLPPATFSTNCTGKSKEHFRHDNNRTASTSVAFVPRTLLFTLTLTSSSVVHRLQHYSPTFIKTLSEPTTICECTAVSIQSFNCSGLALTRAPEDQLRPRPHDNLCSKITTARQVQPINLKRPASPETNAAPDTPTSQLMSAYQSGDPISRTQTMATSNGSTFNSDPEKNIRRHLSKGRIAGLSCCTLCLLTLLGLPLLFLMGLLATVAFQMILCYYVHGTGLLCYDFDYYLAPIAALIEQGSTAAQ